jgi:hypothetical protein
MQRLLRIPGPSIYILNSIEPDLREYVYEWEVKVRFLNKVCRRFVHWSLSLLHDSTEVLLHHLIISIHKSLGYPRIPRASLGDRPNVSTSPHTSPIIFSRHFSARSSLTPPQTPSASLTKTKWGNVGSNTRCPVSLRRCTI